MISLKIKSKLIHWGSWIFISWSPLGTQLQQWVSKPPGVLLLKHRWLGPHPQRFGLGGSGLGPRTCISSRFPLMLLTWGPHCENHSAEPSWLGERSNMEQVVLEQWTRSELRGHQLALNHWSAQEIPPSFLTLDSDSRFSMTQPWMDKIRRKPPPHQQFKPSGVFHELTITGRSIEMKVQNRPRSSIKAFRTACFSVSSNKRYLSLTSWRALSNWGWISPLPAQNRDPSTAYWNTSFWNKCPFSLGSLLESKPQFPRT